MNADSMSKNLERAQQERQQVQTQEALKLLETLKSDFQNSLLAESRSFKNFTAGAERRLKWLMWTALAATVLAILFSSALILGTLWTKRQMIQQAEALRQQMEAVDHYAPLRQQKLIPVGQPVTVKERLFIELKKTE